MEEDVDGDQSTSSKGGKGGKSSKRQIKLEGTGDEGRQNHSKLVGNSAEKNGFKGKATKFSGYKRGVLVWFRMKGFPWWPGIVANESDIPLSQKKVGSFWLKFADCCLFLAFAI
jgi:hypothetical protein